MALGVAISPQSTNPPRELHPQTARCPRVSKIMRSGSAPTTSEHARVRPIRLASGRPQRRSRVAYGNSELRAARSRAARGNTALASQQRAGTAEKGPSLRWMGTLLARRSVGWSRPSRRHRHDLSGERQLARPAGERTQPRALSLGAERGQRARSWALESELVLAGPEVRLDALV
jgi:hypothetical protein